MLQRIYFVVFLFSLTSTALWATPSVDLEMLLQRSNTNHPDNILFNQRLQSTQAMQTGQVYLPNPMLAYEEMAGSGMGAMKELKWEFRQRLPFPWKTYLGRQMYEREAQAIQAEWQQNQKRRKAEITIEYFRWLAVIKKLRIKKEQELLLSQMIAVQRTRYLAQKVSQVELVALQIERGTLLTEVTELEAEVRNQQVRLEILVGPGESLEGREPKEIKLALLDFKSRPAAELEAMLEKNNSELNAAKLMSERGELGASQGRVGWIPDLEVMISERKDNNTGARTTGWEIGIEIPLWLGGELRAMQGRSHSEAVMAETLYREQRRKNLLEVSALLNDQKQLRKQLELMEGGLVQWAGQNVQSARTAYQTGKLEYASFLALMQSAYQNLIAYEDLKIKVLENQEKIKLLLGEKV